MTSKRIIATTVGAGLLLGGVTGLAATLPAGAGAQGDESGGNAGAMHGRGSQMQDMLGAKVADGTITQEQADAMVARAGARRAQHDTGHAKGGPGGLRGRMGGGGPGGMPLDAAATAIGISVDDLRNQLRDGQSLATIATSNGVDVDALIDTLTDEARNRITDMVNRVPRQRMGQADAPNGAGD